jgi:hypothetical protein
LLHPTYKGRWMNALQNVYIQLFHQRNTIISEKPQKEGNPRFALICDVQHKHACPWSPSLSLPSVQSSLLCCLYLSTFSAYVFHWLPFYRPVPLFCSFLTTHYKICYTYIFLSLQDGALLRKTSVYTIHLITARL